MTAKTSLIFLLLPALLAAFHFSRAADALDQAAALWSESQASEQSGDYAGALAALAQFEKVSGDRYLTELRAGWLSHLAKKYGEAVRHYQAASQAAPDAVNPLLGLSAAYQMMSDAPKAERAAEQVLPRDPGNYTALVTVARLNFLKADYRKAGQGYEALLKAYPEDAAALSGAGWANLYLNKKREAAENFRRLLILSPAYAYARQGYEAATGKAP